MRKWFKEKSIMIWYMICFGFLMLIDQRRGSAVGEVQMAFANCTGVVVAALLVPSLDIKDFRNIIYRIWTPICIVVAIAFIILYSHLNCKELIGGIYFGQWVTGVLNIAVWSYIIIYMFRNYKTTRVGERMKQPTFILMVLMFVLMQGAIYDKLLPMWLLLVFGGFYLIGIPTYRLKNFFSGMINGIILSFFVMQIWAFGFRPYDRVRYRGAYLGETQNGLFYLVAFCAFFLKWLWLTEQKKTVQSVLCFGLLAGCVGFTILTGGRSPLVGEVIVTIFLLVYYYISQKKSYYGMVKCGAGLVVSICLLFPVVYGCTRYLPTVLHHPIWFEGDYSEDTSVRSFDPWDSERYVTFEEVLQHNLGRVFLALGIELDFSIHVEAAEVPEKGSSVDNPLYEDDVYPSAFEIRLSIYKYFIKHFNMCGHKRENGVYFKNREFYAHPHNMFIQQAYDYGILAGIVFLGLYIYNTWKAVWRLRAKNVVAGTFLLAILGFGMFEMVMVQGQITLTLMYIFMGLGQRNEEDFQLASDKE